MRRVSRWWSAFVGVALLSLAFAVAALVMVAAALKWLIVDPIAAGFRHTDDQLNDEAWERKA